MLGEFRQSATLFTCPVQHFSLSSMSPTPKATGQQGMAAEVHEPDSLGLLEASCLPAECFHHSLQQCVDVTNWVQRNPATCPMVKQGD